jgi:hypothetical protein
MTSIPDYLSRYAEPEIAAAANLEGSFGHVVQVPAYGEGDTLFAMLGSVPAGQPGETLVVVVLNARADSPAGTRQTNEAARARLAAAASSAFTLSQEPPTIAYRFPRGRVVLIDRSGPGRYLPAGQGVGLARKIGCDFALALVAAGRLNADWLHCTDADVLLPNDYFGQTEALAGFEVAAAIYAFRHRFDPSEALGTAGRLYDLKLRYGVLGLAWAGSPYGYQAMGSCLAIRPRAYAAVGGFPKKNSIEDVLVLNDLAKEGSIARLAGSPILLEGRVSDRVPVSTGQALKLLASQKRALATFRLDHPLAFAYLSAWLEALEAVARSGNLGKALERLPSNSPFFKTDLLTESLEAVGAFAAVREAVSRGKASPRALRRSLHSWFDALRTRQFLDALGKGGLPPLPWRQALAEAPFTALSGSTEDDLDFLADHLATQERALADSPAGLGSN